MTFIMATKSQIDNLKMLRLVMTSVYPAIYCHTKYGIWENGFWWKGGTKSGFFLVHESMDLKALVI